MLLTILIDTSLFSSNNLYSSSSQFTHYEKPNNNIDNSPIKNLQTLTEVGGDTSYVLKYLD